MVTKEDVLGFLDVLDFGPYEIGINDCDVMAVKAREALTKRWPKLKHGIVVMWGVSLPGRLLGREGRVRFPVAGHGILCFKLSGYPVQYYDCTTGNGRDSRRQRSGCWWKMWGKYLCKLYGVFYWKHIWGQYEPMSLIDTVLFADMGNILRQESGS